MQRKLPTSSPERTALYRLFDTDDRLLYVGISSNPKERLKAHAADKPWWPEVASREIEWFPSREQAAAAEVAAIRTEQPIHNHQHRPAKLLSLLPPADEATLRPRLSRIEYDERPADQRMAAHIRALIMAGDVAVGEKLASTAEFERQFRISNVTVQRGLRKLKAEGFAVGRTGSGVFATSPTPERFDDPEARVERVVSTEYAALPPSAATALDLEAEAEGWTRKAVIEVGGWPVQMRTAYRRAPAGGTENLSHTDRLTVRLPTSEELVTLNLPDEVPVMQVFRVAKSAEGAPVEVEVIIDPGHLASRVYSSPDT